jgi:hypothetical protein
MINSFETAFDVMVVPLLAKRMPDHPCLCCCKCSLAVLHTVLFSNHDAICLSVTSAVVIFMSRCNNNNCGRNGTDGLELSQMLWTTTCVPLSHPCCVPGPEGEKLRQGLPHAIDLRIVPDPKSIYFPMSQTSQNDRKPVREGRAEDS